MPGQSNVCGKRFEQKWGDLPHGFDHKYTFTRLGYNMKMTEFQGALGYSQIKRLDDIIDKRVKNYAYLFDKLEVFRPEYMDFVIVPTAENSFISPFGFPIILSEKYSWTLTYLIRYLEENGIATRRMFGGNIIRQPAFRDLPYITMPDLDGADIMLWRTFWIGCHTLITRDDIDYIYNTINKFYIERGLF
jgi:CDP-6-deoxy-D-xylo-4-hexulose-3-dehydrase